jgi:hypothetical protein
MKYAIIFESTSLSQDEIYQEMIKSPTFMGLFEAVTIIGTAYWFFIYDLLYLVRFESYLYNKEIGPTIIEQIDSYTIIEVGHSAKITIKTD